MATKKASSKAATKRPKLTHAAVNKGLRAHHAVLAGAVHRALKKAGLEGLTVRSISFDTPGDFEGPCDPPCGEGQHCVPDSNGGHVRWVCVPDQGQG
jgi:hypothetical protein